MSSGTRLAQQAFTALISPHLDRMYRLAYRLTGSRHDAQDLVQDVLFKLYSEADRLAEVEAASPWLGRVVYNQFVDNKRRYARAKLRIVNDNNFSANPDQAAAVQSSTEDLAEQEFNISRLQSALAQLSDDHQLIINLHDVEGYTASEIAEITGIPIGTVKSRRQRARVRLQELLKQGPA